jgi:hypothetical protein
MPRAAEYENCDVYRMRHRHESNVFHPLLTTLLFLPTMIVFVVVTRYAATK